MVEMGNGVDAWRRLAAEYDPKLASNAQAYLKQILNILRTNKITEASAAIQKLDSLVRQCQDQRKGTAIDPDLKLRRLYGILTAQLESKFILENRDAEVTYIDVMKGATSWILANTSGHAQMDVGSLEQKLAHTHKEWLEETHREWNDYCLPAMGARNTGPENPNGEGGGKKGTP